MMSKTLVNYLIAQLHEVEKGQPWLDEWFDKKFDSIDEDKAFSPPQEGVHSVAEIMSHLVEWRWEIISRLKGNPRKMEVDSPENWKSLAELKEVGWEALLKSFKESQVELINFLSDKDDEFLTGTYPHSTMMHCYYLEGVIHHDLYHLGQIGLVIKLLSIK